MSPLPTPLSTFSRPHAHSTPSAHFPLLKRSPPSLPSLSRSHSSSSTMSASASASPKTPEQSFGESGIQVEGEGEDDFADFIWSPSPSAEDMRMFKPLPSKTVIQRPSTTTTTIPTSSPATASSSKLRRPPFKRRDTPIPSKSSLPPKGERFSYPSEGSTTTLTTSPTPMSSSSIDLRMSPLPIPTTESSRKTFIDSLKNETIERWRTESRPDVFIEEEISRETERSVEVEEKRQPSWMSVFTGQIWLEV